MSRTRIFAALALALVPALAAAETLKESFDRTLPLKPGQRFALSNTNGSVTIEAWDRPEVRIRAEKQVKAGDAKYAREVMAKVRIDVAPSGNGVAVQTVTPDLGDNFFQWLAGQSADAWVTYKITVPRSVNLAIATVNGAVNASDVTGTLNIETVNGRISLARAAGRLELETVNGAIQAQMRELGSAGPHSIGTTNGAVTLQLPQNTRAQLDIRTSNGAIRSDFSTTVKKTGDNRLNGAINGGGPAVVVRTTNGGVKIAKG